MSEPIGSNLPRLQQVRRVEIKSLIFDGVTNYTREIFDVVINHSDNDSESEVWRSKPEVFWGLSKAELIAQLTVQMNSVELEERPLFIEAINQLENEG